MSVIYELHYDTDWGEQFFCKEFSDELECLEEMQSLQLEFPEHQYWYDIIEDGR